MSHIKTVEDLTPEFLADLQLPWQVKVSPDGKLAVYTVKPASQAGEHKKSALWLAHVNVERSARQLTSGLFEDRSPLWSPDSKSIAFLSDRGKVGKACAIFLLPLNGGEPHPLTLSDNEKFISLFKWSPDGQSIAFLSADEKDAEAKKKGKDKDDVKVYGKYWDFAILRLLHVKTKEIEVIVQGEFHCENLAWKPDSQEIAYAVHQTTDLDSPGYHGVDFYIKNLDHRQERHLLRFPGPTTGTLLWIARKCISFLAGVSPSNPCTSICSYDLYLDTKTAEPMNFGHENDAVALCGIPVPGGQSNLLFKIEDGLENKLELICPTQMTAFRDEAHIADFDAAFIAEKLIYAVVKSSSGVPWEVFSGTYSASSR